MSGTVDLVLVDTSVMVAYLSNDPAVVQALVGLSGRVSCVTEMELPGWPKLAAKDVMPLRAMLRALGVIELSEPLKAVAIGIRRERLLKLPDAIIAATAIVLGVPLVTGDKRFQKVADRLEVRLLKLSR